MMPQFANFVLGKWVLSLCYWKFLHWTDVEFSGRAWLCSFSFSLFWAPNLHEVFTVLQRVALLPFVNNLFWSTFLDIYASNCPQGTNFPGYTAPRATVNCFPVIIVHPIQVKLMIAWCLLWILGLHFVMLKLSWSVHFPCNLSGLESNLQVMVRWCWNGSGGTHSLLLNLIAWVFKGALIRVIICSLENVFKCQLI